MAFETVAFLVALSLPVWLVVEQVNSWRRSTKSPQGQLESGTIPGVPAPGPSVAVPSTRGILPAPQRKAA